MTKTPIMWGSVQAAERLGISSRQILRWIHTGQIVPEGKIDGPKGSYVFDPAYIEQFALERGLTPR